MSRAMTWLSASPFHMRRPATTSQSTSPITKMSDRRSTSALIACSGDMYMNLPLTTPTLVSVARLDALAMPKSTSFVWPS